MERFGCVEAFRFPLQLLLADRPGWLEQPVAAVDDTSPTGRLTVLNRRAASAGLRRGMTLGRAVDLVPRLRADTVDATAVNQKSDRIAEALEEFSPRIERDDTRPGVFWLEVSGLNELYDGWGQWIECVKKKLKCELNIYVAVVVGFSRFGTWAAARATGRSGVFETPESEREAAAEVPLEKLHVDPDALQTLRRLGVHTVGELLQLPAEGLRRRLGEQLFELYRKACGDLEAPHPVVHSRNDPSCSDQLDHLETDRNRLLFRIKRRLEQLVETLEQRGEKVAALTLVLHRDDENPVETDVRPAAPTRDTGLLADLVRLRLESVAIAAGISDITVAARGERTATEQMQLFTDARGRDIEAANRAIARVKAEFGADSVLCVRPADAHLPESRFALESLDELTPPDAEQTTARPAIRRFFPTPIRLDGSPEAPCRGGPHVIRGGWWIREVHRDYRLLGADGRLMWVFYDHHRQGWYLHGEY